MTEQKLDEKVAVSRVFVERQFKTKDKIRTEETDEVLSVHKFVTEPARVGLEYGITKNLGNYESARISVLVQVPCYQEEKDAAYDQAKEWAEARIKAELTELVEKGRSNPF